MAENPDEGIPTSIAENLFTASITPTIPITADTISRPPVPNVRVAPTVENPRGYPPFDLRFVPAYTT